MAFTRSKNNSVAGSTVTVVTTTTTTTTNSNGTTATGGRKPSLISRMKGSNTNATQTQAAPVTPTRPKKSFFGIRDKPAAPMTTTNPYANGTNKRRSLLSKTPSYGTSNDVTKTKPSMGDKLRMRMSGSGSTLTTGSTKGRQPAYF